MLAIDADNFMYVGMLLCRRMDNAKHALSEAKKNLRILQEEFSGV